MIMWQVFVISDCRLKTELKVQLNDSSVSKHYLYSIIYHSAQKRTPEVTNQ